MEQLLQQVLLATHQSWYITRTGTAAYVYLSEGFQMRKEKSNPSICTPEQRRRWFGKG